ncbi:hypothetical protein AAMO2058_001234900 [Amorphochlora amoebiformis]
MKVAHANERRTSEEETSPLEQSPLPSHRQHSGMAAIGHLPSFSSGHTHSTTWSWWWYADGFGSGMPMVRPRPDHTNNITSLALVQSSNPHSNALFWQY